MICNTLLVFVCVSACYLRKAHLYMHVDCGRGVRINRMICGCVVFSCSPIRPSIIFSNHPDPQGRQMIGDDHPQSSSCFFSSVQFARWKFARLSGPRCADDLEMIWADLKQPDDAWMIWSKHNRNIPHKKQTYPEQIIYPIKSKHIMSKHIRFANIHLETKQIPFEP